MSAALLLAKNLLAVHNKSWASILFGLGRAVVQRYNPGVMSLNPALNTLIKGLNFLEDVRIDVLILQKIHAMELEITMLPPDSRERYRLVQRKRLLSQALYDLHDKEAAE